MMEHLKRATCAAALAVAGIAADAAERASGSIPIDETFVARGVQWDGGAGGVSYAIIALRESSGKAMVCGALALIQVPGMWRNEVEFSMRAARVYHGRTRLLRSMRRFAGSYYTDRIMGRDAHCTVTDVPWSAEFENPGPIRIRGVNDVQSKAPSEGGRKEALAAETLECLPSPGAELGVC